MTDMSQNDLKFQGKKVKAIYMYKATMNDELSFNIDDIIIVTQGSEDETWLEGTLNGRTGWFPSNYVEIIEQNEGQCISDSNESLKQFNDLDSQSDDAFRIKSINELKRSEEDFLDDMCKFIKTALIPLQANKNHEIFPTSFLTQLNSSIDELLRCHQVFFQQLKEIPENSDAKIGCLMINMATRFKSVYESYARSNPKFTNAINKKKDLLAKFFESSLNRMNISNSSPSMNTSAAVTLYLTKYLATPFKQLELYIKLLKELYRFTEDYHIDRGDVQRSMEFYSELSSNMHEIRHKKECELDIMSSRINNIEEDIFQNGESIFLSSVLTINEQGDRKDQILLLFSNSLVFLSQNSNRPNEFDFDKQIFFLNQTMNSVVQVKKLTSVDLLNSSYGSNLSDVALIKYCFELILNPTNRYLIICSTNYDLKMWLELISHQLSKAQFSLNNKSLKSPGNLLNNSQSFKAGLLTSPVSSKHNTSTSFKQLTGNLSGSTLNNSISSSTSKSKVFSLRPHPPLIPHFQLPNDVTLSPSIQANANGNNNNSENQTLKRFMYKKAKLSEPFGKYHGADDDLKLLTVIESFCKIKTRQSVNINVQEGVTSPVHKQQANQSIVTEEKNRGVDSNIQTMIGDLNDTKRSNKELKMTVMSLQKQLEQEKNSRQKLETYIRKVLKINNCNLSDLTKIMPNCEHESSI